MAEGGGGGGVGGGRVKWTEIETKEREVFGGGNCQ